MSQKRRRRRIYEVSYGEYGVYKELIPARNWESAEKKGKKRYGKLYDISFFKWK